MTATPIQIPEGTVASRVQAFQQQCRQQDQRSLPATNSFATSIRTSDHLGGLNHDKTSPMLKVPKSRLANEDTYQHSSNSQNVFLNPLRLGRAYNDEWLNYVGSSPAPTSTRPVSSIGSTLFTQSCNAQNQDIDKNLSDQFDGPFELTNQGASLKPDATEREVREHHSLTNEEPMYELGTMLQDAINQGGKDDTHAHLTQTSYPSASESSRSGLSSNKSFRVVHSARGFYENTKESNITDTGSSNFNNTRVRGLSRSPVANDVDMTRERTLDRDLTPGFKTLRQLDVTSDDGVDYKSRPNLIKIPPVLSGSHAGHDLPFFPRYRSNQERQRAAALAVHDAPFDKQKHRIGESDSPTVLPIISEHKFACRRLEHKPKTSIDGRRSCLLPLALPRMLEVQEEERPVSAASTTSKPDHPFIASHSRTTMLENPRTGYEEASHKDEMYHASSDSEESPSKLETQSCAEHTRTVLPKNIGKGPSIIESRIRDLLTASRKHDITSSQSSGTINICKTKDTSFHGNTQGSHNNKENGMPAQQLSQNEPKKVLDMQGDRQFTTSGYKNEKRTPSPMRRTAGNANIAPASPSTKRCKDLVHTPSPRGSGYSLEQKFAFSPPRSQTRANNNAVRVSFEIRRSPERGDRVDQMLIVRASVDPEEDQIFESST